MGHRLTLKAARHIPMLATAGLMVASAIIAVVSEQGPTATVPLLVLPATLPPLIVERWARIRIPFSLQLQYAVLLIAGPYIGEHIGLYHAWDPWDKWVHLYSGFAISLGIIFALGITLRRYSLSLPPWVEAVIIIAVKACVALLWEVAEFFWDLIFGTSAQDHNFDTMTDMMLGTLPGFLLAAALILHRSKGWFGHLDSLLNAPIPSAGGHR